MQNGLGALQQLQGGNWLNQYQGGLGGYTWQYMYSCPKCGYCPQCGQQKTQQLQQAGYIAPQATNSQETPSA